MPNSYRRWAATLGLLLLGSAALADETWSAVATGIPRQGIVLRPAQTDFVSGGAETAGLGESVIYRNDETPTIVINIGRPLYARASRYEFFLHLEGRPVRRLAATLPRPADSGR